MNWGKVSTMELLRSIKRKGSKGQANKKIQEADQDDLKKACLKMLGVAKAKDKDIDVIY